MAVARAVHTRAWRGWEGPLSQVRAGVAAQGGFCNDPALEGSGRRNAATRIEATVGLGIWEILLLAALVALFLGSGKLPGLMGELSRGIRRFRDDLVRTDAPAAEATAEPVAALPRPDRAHRSQVARS